MTLYSDWIKRRKEEEDRRNSEEQERLNMLKLSEWLEARKNDPAIFVDQDETILHTETAGYLPKKGKYAVQHAVFKNIMGHELGIILRPNAAKFLKECREIAPTYILTAGMTAFQEKVLDAVGLLTAVDDVFGRDRFDAVPKGKNSILIDNLPHNSGNSYAKLQAMGGGMYLKVPDWEARNANDDVLMTILPKIRQAFASAVA